MLRKRKTYEYSLEEQIIYEFFEYLFSDLFGIIIDYVSPILLTITLKEYPKKISHIKLIDDNMYLFTHPNKYTPYDVLTSKFKKNTSVYFSNHVVSVKHNITMEYHSNYISVYINNKSILPIIREKYPHGKYKLQDCRIYKNHLYVMCETGDFFTSRCIIVYELDKCNMTKNINCGLFGIEVAINYVSGFFITDSYIYIVKRLNMEIMKYNIVTEKWTTFKIPDCVVYHISNNYIYSSTKYDGLTIHDIDTFDKIYKLPYQQNYIFSEHSMCTINSSKLLCPSELQECRTHYFWRIT